MKRFIISLCWLVVGIGIISVMFISQPSRASAGSLPCFLCHGVNFEGSDLAPRVAGTKLTDEEILKQVHNPRGVMPAFKNGEFPDDQIIIGYIRSLPSPGATPAPTKALTARERSEALATISAVAAARATAVLQMSSSAISATPAPARSAATVTAASASSSSATPTESSLGMFIILGGLLTVIAGVLWTRQQR